jgi:hypothetical protein
MAEYANRTEKTDATTIRSCSPMLESWLRGYIFYRSLTTISANRLVAKTDHFVKRGLAMYRFLVGGEIDGSISIICQKNRWAKIRYYMQAIKFPAHHSEGICKIASDEYTVQSNMRGSTIESGPPPLPGYICFKFGVIL